MEDETTSVAALSIAPQISSSPSANVAVEIDPAKLPPIIPFDLDRAKSIRSDRKKKEFRRYLVDTKVVEAIVKILLPLYESDDKPPSPQNLLIAYFGHYRNPMKDEIEELHRRRSDLLAANKELTERRMFLSRELAISTTKHLQVQLWKAIARDSELMTSLQIYQRLCDRKKPKAAMKCHAFSKHHFFRFLSAATSEFIEANNTCDLKILDGAPSEIGAS